MEVVKKEVREEEREKEKGKRTKMRGKREGGGENKQNVRTQKSATFSDYMHTHFTGNYNF